MRYLRVINWFAGWRLDLDGFWVRARRATDPDLALRPDLGLTEEACIAARSPAIAHDIDRLAHADWPTREKAFGAQP
jgi:hypothetical protein